MEKNSIKGRGDFVIFHFDKMEKSIIEKFSFRKILSLPNYYILRSDYMESSLPEKTSDILVVVIMPAYNVAQVLPKTVASLPKKHFSEIILVDDGSTDETASVGEKLGLKVISHARNRGYGGAQKTGYKAAIERGADVVVMVHGDNQYDPTLLPKFVSKVREGYDVVSGSRMILGDVLKNGMPIWKFIPNRFLTWLENKTFNTSLTDYHNGYRAYSGAFLKKIPFDLLSDRFDFDTDILVQAAILRSKIAEIPHPTRYLKENSQMSFSKGVIYGLGILKTIFLYQLHKHNLWRQPVFEKSSLHRG